MIKINNYVCVVICCRLGLSYPPTHIQGLGVYLLANIVFAVTPLIKYFCITLLI